MNEGEATFDSISSRVPIYSDYRGAITSQTKSRKLLPEYLRALAATGRYDIVLRPHPREQFDFYRHAIEALPAAMRQNVSLEPDTNITSLILGSDVQISCGNLHHDAGGVDRRQADDRTYLRPPSAVAAAGAERHEPRM